MLWKTGIALWQRDCQIARSRCSVFLTSRGLLNAVGDLAVNKGGSTATFMMGQSERT